jgi:hypothetical protein
MPTATPTLSMWAVVALLEALQLRPWMADAHCGSAGIWAAEQWFSDPEGHGPPKRVCAGCPVRVQCAEYALANDTRQDEGIWGGHTEHQRRLERQRRRHQAKRDAARQLVAA